jgi:zinc D-Ala-D-Ala dipeptidase
VTALIRIPEVRLARPLELTRVVEESEPLEVLRSQGNLMVRPAYFAMGYCTATSSVEVRQGVLHALLLVAGSLPEGISLIVWDGLRTLATQAEILRRFRDVLMSAPGNGDVDMARYVTPLPTTISDFRTNPPPHCTGGAVDVTLGDADGLPLDLGADFDEFSERASLTYCERSDFTIPRAIALRQRELRRTLYWAMRRGGFSPYADEFWHFEFGTRRAAAFGGVSTAPYGPAVAWEDCRSIECV